MSRGLGVTQRRLLAALYSGHIRTLLRWKITRAGLTRQRRGLPSGSEFYPITQLGLAELHVPSLQDNPRRSAGDHGSWDWFSLNSQPTTDTDRDLLRSWRAAYRRAAQGLVSRGLIETRTESMALHDLGQATFFASAPRLVVMARITETGRRYVEQRRAEFVGDTCEITDYLRAALRANGFDDIAEAPARLLPHQAVRRPLGSQPPRNRQPRAERRTRNPRRKQRRSAQPASSAPIQSLGYDELIAQLVSEGFTVETVRANILQWRRKEQRELRELYGDLGTPLPQRVFDPSEISELRQLLLALG